MPGDDAMLADQSGLLELALRTQGVRNRAIKQLEGVSLDVPVRFFGNILEWERCVLMSERVEHRAAASN